MALASLKALALASGPASGSRIASLAEVMGKWPLWGVANFQEFQIGGNFPTVMVLGALMGHADVLHLANQSCAQSEQTLLPRSRDC